MRKFFGLVLVLAATASFAQSSLNSILTVSVIDSIAHENYSTAWYTGWYSPKLTTDGHNVYLAAKKFWKEADTNRTEIIFGRRLGQGKWQFETAATPDDRVYPQLVGIAIGSGNPVVLYVDRFEFNPFQLMAAFKANGQWRTAYLETDAPAGPQQDYDPVVEKYDEAFTSFTSGQRAGAIWWRKVVNSVDDAGNLLIDWHLVAKQVGDDTATTIAVSSWRIGRWNFGKPAATPNGEYVAFGAIAPDTISGYPDITWYSAIYVYRRSGNSYVLDFADSVWFEAAYPHLYNFRLAIGQRQDGSVLLFANGYLGNPMYVRSQGHWTKTFENFPLQNGTLDPGASSRPYANETVQFSGNGTAFWGDLNGFAALNFSAEISLCTPDNVFRSFAFPPYSRFPDGGIYQGHDFVLTDDDTLHFVYEFQPWQGYPKYLMEGRVYVPSLLDFLTGVEKRGGLSRLPDRFELEQNYPNPFNPRTTIVYTLPKAEKVTVRILNGRGETVRDLSRGIQSAGRHEILFEAGNLPSGVYFCQVEAGNQIQTRKMILLK